jgi:hypothetical protein
MKVVLMDSEMVDHWVDDLVVSKVDLMDVDLEIHLVEHLDIETVAHLVASKVEKMVASQADHLVA